LIAKKEIARYKSELPVTSKLNMVQFAESDYINMAFINSVSKDLIS
jgi:hypothetical protein